MKEWVWNASFIVQEEFRAKLREVFLASISDARKTFIFWTIFGTRRSLDRQGLLNGKPSVQTRSGTKRDKIGKFFLGSFFLVRHRNCSTGLRTKEEMFFVCAQARKRLKRDDYILISTSTPAGRFKLMRESIVRSVGFTMSIMRLCTRISY